MNLQKVATLAALAVMSTLGEGACGGFGGGPLSPVRDFEPPRIERPVGNCPAHEEAALREQIAEGGPNADFFRERLARCTG